MSTVLPKSEMSEEDVKLQYITPAITSKWDRGKITMETQVTDGKINLKGNFVFCEKPKRADYILYLNANNLIAIIEAKDNKHRISHGLQQAMYSEDKAIQDKNEEYMMTQYNEKVYKLASDNTKYDADGNAVILENDEWRDEKEWDEVFEQMQKERQNL